MYRSRYSLSLLAVTSIVVASAACGDGSGPAEPEPMQFVSVSAGWESTCGLTVDHELYCWGLGRSFVERRLAPTQIPTSIRLTSLHLSIGDHGYYGCGLVDPPATFCWGWMLVNVDGGLHLGDAPQPLANDIPMRTLSTGRGHICGVTDNMDAYCWGDYDGGRRGQGVPTPGGVGTDLVPNKVVGNLPFTMIAAGDWHTCGLVMNGQVFCWGKGDRLGNPSAPVSTNLDDCGFGTPCSLVPVPLASNRQFVAVDAGANHSCGLTTNGEVFCWAGDVPALVVLPERARSISAGGNHSCAVSFTDQGYCWGRNSEGQLGNGTTIASGPTRVVGNIRFQRITAGQKHSCGISADKEIYCWGFNDVGQLGIGTTENSTVPRRIQGP